MRFLNDSNGQRKYHKGFIALQNLSKRSNIKPLALAQMIMEEKRDEINKYVKSGGMTPESDLRKLGIQVVLLHDRRVKKKMRETNLSHDEAEKLVLREEEVKSYTGESECFAPALLSVVTQVGGSAIDAINKKRQQQGKSPLMSGKGWSKVKGFLSQFSLSQKDEGGLRVDVKGTAGDGEPKTQLEAGLQGAQEGYKKEYIKNWIREHKLIVILIIGAVIVGGYFLLKKK